MPGQCTAVCPDCDNNGVKGIAARCKIVSGHKKPLHACRNGHHWATWEK